LAVLGGQAQDPVRVEGEDFALRRVGGNGVQEVVGFEVVQWLQILEEFS